MRNKKTSLFIVFVAFFFIQACSRLQVAYDFAPRLIANSLDENFDFSSDRYSQIKSSIAKDFKSNQELLKTELIYLIDELLKHSKSNEIKPSDVAKIYSLIHASQIKIIEAFRPTFNEVILNLSNKELLSYKVEIENKHKKFQEKLKSEDKFIESSIGKFEDNMDMIFDDVTDDQIELYRNFIKRNFSYFKSQLQHKRKFLMAFEEKAKDKTELQKFVMKYFSADDSLKDAEYLHAQKEFLTDMFSETVNLWKTLTPKQLKHYEQFLNKLRIEIIQLKIQ